MKAFAASWALPDSITSKPGSFSPEGSTSDTPADSIRSLDLPSTRIVLQWRYWSFTNSIVCPSFDKTSTAFSPSGSTRPSNSTEGEFSSETSASTLSPSAVL